MEKIILNAELLFELASKQQWINRVPSIMPEKTRNGEQWVWIDKNGNVFECGADFSAADKLETYPCKVYRLQSVSVEMNDNNGQCNVTQCSYEKCNEPAHEFGMCFKHYCIDESSISVR